MILNYTLVGDCGDEDRNKRKMSCDDKLLADSFVVLGKLREIKLLKFPVENYTRCIFVRYLLVVVQLSRILLSIICVHR